MKSLISAESVLRAYEHAMTMNVLQSSLDNFGLVAMAHTAWRGRQCFGENGGEVSLVSIVFRRLI